MCGYWLPTPAGDACSRSRRSTGVREFEERAGERQ